jgi:hypothetical protein
MRLQYLASERGDVLRIDAPAAYSVLLATNGAIAIGPSASLAAIETWCSSVDPSITGAP